MSKRGRRTYFIDLDGTLVKWHKDPKDYSNDPEFLPGVLKHLADLKQEGSYCVLTTGRSKEAAQPVLDALMDTIAFKFDQCLFDLPTGIRILVNDRIAGRHGLKAYAFNVKRNRGWRTKI